MNVNNSGGSNNNNASNANGVCFGSSPGRQSNKFFVKSDLTERRSAYPSLTGKYSVRQAIADAACMAELDGDVLFHAMSLMPLKEPSNSGAADQHERRSAMTSEERREQRFQRRKAKRMAKKEELHAANEFDTVFSYAHLYRSYRFCKKGVGWKASVQKYIVNAPLNVYRTWKKLKDGRFKTPGFHEFVIFERGKCRRIRSTMIGERVVQRCLCDYSLIPLLERTFIYDNGASMKGKGYDFAVKRLTRHLHEHYRKHGTDGYILLFDFSKFFDHVSHELVKRIVRNEITDQKIVQLCDHLIDAFGSVGLGLGSQISQVLALASANRLDHYIKEVLRIRGYGRYMDDGYLIHHGKDYLKKCLAGIKKICKELHIKLNTKKTQIVKLSHGFTWLKIRFFITDTGRVVKKIYRRSVHVMRRKLKTFRLKLSEGSMSLTDVYNSWQSWRSYARRFNACKTIQSMERLYYSLITVRRR